MLFKNQVTKKGKAFIYEKRYNIGKSLIGEVSSSSSFRSLIYRCFRNACEFSGLIFEDKFNNFWKHLYEGFMWDGCMLGVQVKS